MRHKLLVLPLFFALAVTARGDWVTTTVAGGTNPFAVGVNPVTDKIYATNYTRRSVTVIDGATNATSTVAAGTVPWAAGVNPMTNKIYVANYNSANVTVIDGATNATSTLAVGTRPYSLAANPATDRIYVGDNGSDSVTVIDEAPVSDTQVWAVFDPLFGDTTSSAQPALTGRGVNRWTPKPTTRIEGVLNRLSTAQQAWSWAQITQGAGTDSVSFAYPWGTDSLIMGENFVLGVGLGIRCRDHQQPGPGKPLCWEPGGLPCLPGESAARSRREGSQGSEVRA